ncbi:TetR/AcrR family transcriptional regulator [Burkholderia vietnamiensis]|jgi:AcrR family transcriptional regulator|uniref:TetR/AcrR family transcriptional regulator n=1 Tax=Burkholderia vietnamiensis TaxID=60552 RepID=UPI000752D939|nr:TetR/AcrR family transcriptional regulator [Burkholderia vietnamiensis]KVF29367.1 TetR family transcriptional regulator [Burkholderia vietnamiensis]MBR8284036.1 TetR/AcrR family transcriptional regulator [Burkholderia vietnamiensis]MCA8207356.1 TetR/AcrR family transcriptional regulator [Burkholderia vietnamiensis]MDN7410601.1 TetR/AcrR family transcriptional regulator [Burkholderia vietnamiensis]MDN8111920.1 TetR/AcrR family transcriptional regulator [Burkholderia vietnamiensis]
MPPRHVQVPAPPGQPGAQPAPALRRRPRQSRAQATSDALQQAFVQLLLERGHANVTIREIAAVAGVSVGTFYEYFGDKQSLAALCIHRRVLALAERLRAAAHGLRGMPRAEVAAALVDLQVEVIAADAALWGALFVLERQVSSLAAYRRHYAAYVALWRDALAQAGDPPPAARLEACARMAHALCYGGVSQALLTLGPALDFAALRRELHAALGGYLAALHD